MSVDGVKRRPRAVMIGSILALLFDAFWVFAVALAATPCEFSGKGMLTPTAQCPVQASHIVSAVIGGASCISLFVAGVAGIRYAGTGKRRTRRIFRIGLLLSAVLIVTLLIAGNLLPRTLASD